METSHADGQMNSVSLEALWIEEKLKRYRTAGVVLLVWAIFVAEVMAEGRYHRPYLFFACSGIAVLLTVAGLGVQRYRKQFLLAACGMHLSLWAPCLYLGGEWASGEDISGLAWFWLLGGACLVDFGVTVKNLVVLCRRRSFKLVARRRSR